MLDFVITGTGRSGTMWAAKALTAAGLPCTHENWCSSWTDHYGDNGDWRYAPFGESSWQAAPFVGEMQAAGVTVVHLVRHPMDVASSMVANRMLTPEPDGSLLPWHEFIAAHIGDRIWRLHPHDRALQFWTDWNKQIAQPDLRWFVDHPAEDQFSALAARLGRSLDFARAEQVPPDVNHWRKVKQMAGVDFTRSIYDDAMDLWQSYF